ncbi:CHAP domain-containing protein [Citricoccus sp. SGAir0253]|uniref:transglycosylase SLT domain-containing protein n=1 Tax=Citricoccus sp. SGAir0253 TaxID=2567881 RepID=UPI0010CD53BF|nr:transglycosylase SLT domain-containing protein [Citricoccus sp. SGAir0253]QCU77950.1 CHAP domain-containing protein [Citricoccus sp. SGAir0253]
MLTKSAAGLGCLGTALLGLILSAVLLLLTLAVFDGAAAEGGVCRPEAGIGTAPSEYQQDLAEAAEHSGIPVGILAAQIDQESRWDPRAVSPVGAQGLTQFMPATWAQWGNGADPFDPRAAITAQGRYMKHLRAQVAPLAQNENEAIRLTLAAYNAGPGAVRQHQGIPPFQETQQYVQKITTAAGGTGGAGLCDSLGQLTVASVGGDDYPYREPVGVDGWGHARSIFGHTQRQCTDFVMWRINQSLGWSEDQGDPPFTFAALGVGYGPGQNGAGSWKDILTQAEGVSFHTSDPRPGDIAWWGYDDIGGGYGHVGFVAAVDGDTAIIEHYNLATPNTYSVTRTPAHEVPGYIRLPATTQE